MAQMLDAYLSERTQIELMLADAFGVDHEEMGRF